MIICGFPGVGRTYCADNFPRVVDLDWCNRDTIIDLSYSGYDIMLSLGSIKELKNMGIDFITVIPSIELRDEYEDYYLVKDKNDGILYLLYYYNGNLEKHKLILQSWGEILKTLTCDYDLIITTLGSGEYISNRFLKWSDGFKSYSGISLVNRNEIREKLNQIDSVDWEYGNARDKVCSILDGVKEYSVSRKEIVL